MNNKVALVIGAALAVTLVGCDQEPPSQAEEKAYVEDQASDAVRKQMAEDQKDLDATVKELQSKDPSVKDAYYSINEKGEKVLHIVREEANGKSSDSVWPMVGGMAAGAMGGYLLAKAMNSQGGYNQYQSSNRPMHSQQFNEDDRRRERNTATSGYANSMMNQQRSAVRSNPTFRSNMNSSVSSYRSSGSFKASSGTGSSRATGIMSGGSGARASSHSGMGS